MILSILPDKPGCYQYFDEKGTIIYVGKAKNLKRRVSSYFNMNTTATRHVYWLSKSATSNILL